MKPSRYLIGLTVLMLNGSLLTAGAANLAGVGNQPMQSATSSKPQAVRPLQNQLTISPMVQRRMVSPAEVSLLNMDEIQTQYESLVPPARTYEVGVQTMPAIQRQCAEKNYSVQDQSAAGCVGSETLDQCGEKLVRHCIATYNRPGGGSLVAIQAGADGTIQMPSAGTTSASTQGFIEAARQVAQKARSLGETLQRYANQAEQRANRWR